jgi:predicted molibdopterin-dependent oxidoreductase YjgC
MANVVEAGQSGKQSEVEISIDGTAVAANEGELLVEAILLHKELPHICYHSPLMDASFTGHFVHLSENGSSFQSTKCWKMKGDSLSLIRNRIGAKPIARNLIEWLLCAAL